MNALDYNKVVCAVEEKDITDLNNINGGINVLPGYISGTRKPITTPVGYELNEEYIKNWTTTRCITTYEPYFKYYNIKDLPADTNYLYIITIKNVNYFELNKDGLKKVSGKVLQDVKNGLAKLVLLMPTEGTSGTARYSKDFEYIQQWIDEVDIPSERVYFINNNLISEQIAKQKEVKYNVSSVISFEAYNNVFDYPECIEYSPTKENFLYLNFNRTTKMHRISFLAELVNSDMFDKGLNSFNFSLSHFAPLADRKVFDNIIYHYEQDPEKIKKCGILYDKWSQNIDDVSKIQDQGTVPDVDLYRKTFCSVVTESILDYNSVFISEKTFKPIIMEHPFMVLGSSGILKELKNMGYKTYSRWFNEDYDNEDCSLRTKVQIIVNCLKHLSKKSVNDLIYDREQMKSTALYNKEVLKERTKKLYTLENKIFFSDDQPKAAMDKIYEIYNNW